MITQVCAMIHPTPVDVKTSFNALFFFFHSHIFHPLLIAPIMSPADSPLSTTALKRRRYASEMVQLMIVGV